MLSTVECALKFIHELKLQCRNRVLVVGVNGPQGLGKSWLAQNVCDSLGPLYRAIAVLMDDFYLKYSEQQQVSLSAKNSGNSLLNGRGLPGTHDVKLAIATVSALLDGESETQVPKYNKLAFSGLGDRDGWKTVNGPVDIILFEGWFNGYTSIDDSECARIYKTSKYMRKYPIDAIYAVNNNLRSYSLLWNFFDGFIVIQTLSIENVYTWREQQEEELRKRTGSGMSPGQVKQFIDRYMPLYEMCYSRCINRGMAPYNLAIRISSDRLVESSLEFVGNESSMDNKL